MRNEYQVSNFPAASPHCITFSVSKTSHFWGLHKSKEAHDAAPLLILMGEMKLRFYQVLETVTCSAET